MLTTPKQAFIVSSAISVTGALAAGICNYAFHFLVSRKISVPEYGELQALLALFSVLGILGAAFSNYVVRGVSGLAGEGKVTYLQGFAASARATAGSVAAWITVIMLALTPLLMHWLRLDGATGLLFVYVSGAFSLVTNVTSGTLSGLERFGRVNTASTAGAAIKLLSGFVIALYFPTASLVAASLLLGAIANWLLAKWLLGRVLPEPEPRTPRPARAWWLPEKAVLQSMRGVLVFSVLLILLANVDILLVKNAASPELAGYFSAFKTLGNVIYFINSAIIAVILPRAAGESRSGRPASRGLVLLSYGLVVLVSGVGILGCRLFPDPIIHALFGAKYAFSVSALWLFAVLAGVLSLLVLEANIAYARNDYFISYILAAAAIAMTVGVYARHGSLEQIVGALIAAVTGGWVLSLLRHLIIRRQYRGREVYA